MNIQTELAGSVSAITDSTSLNSALFYNYSDSFDRQIETHGFPSALGEAMITFSRAQSSSRVAEDYLWSTQSAKNTPTDFPLYPPVLRYPALENNRAAPFSSTNYGVDEGCLPSVNGNSRLNEWISRGDEPSRFRKELSLSLGSDVASSRKTHAHVGSADNTTSCSSNSLSLNFNSYKAPTTSSHLSPMLSGSRFLNAMQEILAEVAYYAMQDFDQTSYGAGQGQNASFNSSRLVIHNKRDVEAKKKHLLSLLQMVDEQYNQCLDEIHTVVSAFHAVTELDPNLHARFALPTVSLMYRKLRERISSYILAMGDKFSEGETREDETSFMHKQWALQQLSKSDHQLWRPQRGLPERSVSVLKAWMYQNFLHPYPKDAEKHLLAMKSGLTRSQVSNWFINARVRLWKPMIEEMYAEMHRRKARRNEEETNVALRNQSMRFTMG